MDHTYLFRFGLGAYSWTSSRSTSSWEEEREPDDFLFISNDEESLSSAGLVSFSTRSLICWINFVCDVSPYSCTCLSKLLNSIF